MRRNKRERQRLLQATIEENPFITDEQLAEKFSVSIQTIRLDRLELSIPELRERIKHVAERTFADEVKSLPIEEVIGEIIDMQLDESAISIFDVKKNMYLNEIKLHEDIICLRKRTRSQSRSLTMN